MRIAAYRQYNKMIPSTAECCSTGKMKRGYGVEGILRMIGPDKNYCETHNAYLDAIDELHIVKLLASPTPMLFDDSQIPVYKKLADTLHAYDSKVALQIFHPEYDVPGVGRMIGASMMAMKEAEGLKAAGDMAGFGAKMQEVEKLRKEAYAKLHHDMQHFVSEATKEQLDGIKNAIAQASGRAMEAGIDAIEVHGDRLLGSLCSELLNHRTDEYGGSFENRIRYALEVVAAIKEAAPTLMIEIRLPQSHWL